MNLFFSSVNLICRSAKGKESGIQYGSSTSKKKVLEENRMQIEERKVEKQ